MQAASMLYKLEEQWNKVARDQQNEKSILFFCYHALHPFLTAYVVRCTVCTTCIAIPDRDYLSFTIVLQSTTNPFSVGFYSKLISITQLLTTKSSRMKFAILFLSMCMGASVVSAFVSRSPNIVSASSSVTTTLNAISTPPNNSDDWSEKRLYVRESTTPVADPKFSRLQRMMMKDVVIPADFSLTWAVALLGPLIMSYHPCKYSQYFNITCYANTTFIFSF
ncbi:MAG: hypothetical protein ACI8RD_002247 [Bacillariaceae sp.]